MYKIRNWFPIQRDCHGAAYNIILTNKWFRAVKDTKLDQEMCNNLIKNNAKSILEGHGMNFSTENPEFHFKIIWDNEIGPRVIEVLGNACSLGYDPYSQFGCDSSKGEKLLVCHNTDTLAQASMQLTIFLMIAEFLEYEYEKK